MIILTWVLQIFLSLVITYFVTTSIWLYTVTEAGGFTTGCLIALFITVISWGFFREQLVWIALGTFSLYCMVRFNSYFNIQRPDELWMSATLNDAREKIRNHWSNPEIISVRGYVVAEFGYPKPACPTLFLDKQAPLLRSETINDAFWEIHAFEFSGLRRSDSPRQHLYLTLHLKTDSKHFVIPFLIATKAPEKPYHLEHDFLNGLRVLRNKPCLILTAFSDNWESIYYKNRHNPSDFYHQYIEPQPSFTISIPIPPVNDLKQYIPISSWDLLEQSRVRPIHHLDISVYLFSLDKFVDYAAQPQPSQWTFMSEIYKFFSWSGPY